MGVARGLALVEVKHKRKGDFSDGSFEGESNQIKKIMKRVRGVRTVRELKQRLRGDSHVPTFKFYATVDAADTQGLKDVFRWIDKALHRAGHSHVEGYEA